MEAAECPLGGLSVEMDAGNRSPIPASRRSQVGRFGLSVPDSLKQIILSHFRT